MVAKIDYNLSDEVVVLTPGMTTAQVSVQTLQDEIYEADEEFFVMFLETDDPRVNLSLGRFASLGIIRDDDSKQLLVLN